MAVLAIGTVSEINFSLQDNHQFRVHLSGFLLDGSGTSMDFWVGDFEADLSSDTIISALKDQFRQYLIDQHNVHFGVTDSVHILSGIQ